jgi:hypothetical protein
MKGNEKKMEKIWKKYGKNEKRKGAAVHIGCYF